MRITNQSMTNNLLRNLNKGMRQLDKLQLQLASGKRIQLPSDDPAAVMSIQRLRTSLMETEQYKKNVDDASSWLDSTDTTLDSLTNVLHRLKEITVYGANGTLAAEDKVSLSLEVEQIFTNVLQLANSTHNGKYLFSGQMTTTVPYERASSNSDDAGYFAVNYSGGYKDPSTFDTSEIKKEISAGTYIAINVAPHKMNAAGELEDGLFEPIFNALSQVRASLAANDGNKLGTTDLSNVDAALDGVLRYRSEVGAKMNRVDLAKERLEDLTINFTSLLSEVEDVDVAETIMYMKSAENNYRMALSVGARIIQPSLLDYLR